MVCELSMPVNQAIILFFWSSVLDRLDAALQSSLFGANDVIQHTKDTLHPSLSAQYIRVFSN